MWHGPSRHARRFGSGLSLCNGWMLSGRSWCFWALRSCASSQALRRPTLLIFTICHTLHSLPGSVLLSLVFGVIVALFTSGNRVTTILLVAAASFSHWVLDLVVHVHDLPLYDNAAKIGFGLWRHVVLSFYANFGPPPSSPEAMAAIALAFYLVLALLAAWVEPIATSRPI